MSTDEKEEVDEVLKCHVCASLMPLLEGLNQQIQELQSRQPRAYDEEGLRFDLDKVFNSLYAAIDQRETEILALVEERCESQQPNSDLTDMLSHLANAKSYCDKALVYTTKPELLSLTNMIHGRAESLLNKGVLDDSSRKAEITFMDDGFSNLLAEIENFGKIFNDKDVDAAVKENSFPQEHHGIDDEVVEQIFLIPSVSNLSNQENPSTEEAKAGSLLAMFITDGGLKEQNNETKRSTSPFSTNTDHTSNDNDADIRWPKDGVSLNGFKSSSDNPYADDDNYPDHRNDQTRTCSRQVTDTGWNDNNTEGTRQNAYDAGCSHSKPMQDMGQYPGYNTKETDPHYNETRNLKDEHAKYPHHRCPGNDVLDEDIITPQRVSQQKSHRPVESNTSVLNETDGKSGLKNMNSVDSQKDSQAMSPDHCENLDGSNSSNGSNNGNGDPGQANKTDKGVIGSENVSTPNISRPVSNDPRPENSVPPREGSEMVYSPFENCMKPNNGVQQSQIDPLDHPHNQSHSRDATPNTKATDQEKPTLLEMLGGQSHQEPQPTASSSALAFFIRSNYMDMEDDDNPATIDTMNYSLNPDPDSEQDATLTIIPKKYSVEKVIKCGYMEFDKATVFEDNHVTREGKLINEPPLLPLPDTSWRFKNYKGALSTRPLDSTGISYLEFWTNIEIRNIHDGRSLIFEAAIADRDVIDLFHKAEDQIHAWGVSLSHCPEHKGLCRRTWGSGKELEHYPATLPNEPKTTARLRFGFLLTQKQNKLVVIDCNEEKVLMVAKNVKITKPLWPVFGVYNTELSHVETQLVSCTKLNIDKSIAWIILQNI